MSWRSHMSPLSVEFLRGRQARSASVAYGSSHSRVFGMSGFEQLRLPWWVRWLTTLEVNLLTDKSRGDFDSLPALHHGSPATLHLSVIGTYLVSTVQCPPINRHSLIRARSSRCWTLTESTELALWRLPAQSRDECAVQNLRGGALGRNCTSSPRASTLFYALIPVAAVNAEGATQ